MEPPPFEAPVPCSCGAVGRKPHTPACEKARQGKTRQRLWQLAQRAKGRCSKCGGFCYPNPDTGKPYAKCGQCRLSST